MPRETEAQRKVRETRKEYLARERDQYGTRGQRELRETIAIPREIAEDALALLLDAPIPPGSGTSTVRVVDALKFALDIR